MLIKKKRIEQIGKSDLLPEGIFGDTSEPDSRIKPKRRSTRIPRTFFGFKPDVKIFCPQPLRKKKRLAVSPKRPKYEASMMPTMEINYDATLPPEAEGLPMANVVGMTEAELKIIIKNTDQFTAELSKLMLQQVTPGVLAFDASSNYVRAVLKSGLKIDTEVDEGVLEAVQALARLEVISFYIDKMNVASSMKRRLREKFVDGLSSASLDVMAKIAKGEEMSKAVSQLEAVLVKRSEAKPGEKNARSARAPKPVPAEEIAVPAGVRRSRKDNPLVGGF